MRDNMYGKKALIVFFAITVILSAAAETLIVTAGLEWMYAVLMWIPAIAAFAAICVLRKENGQRLSLKSVLSGVGFMKCSFRYVLMGSYMEDVPKACVGYPISAVVIVSVFKMEYNEL